MSTSLNRITNNRELVAWLEIPAVDFDRAVSFYRNGLSLQIQVIIMNGIRHGILRNQLADAKGAIVEATESSEGKGPVIFFRSRYDISLTLENITASGGSVIIPKTLIRNFLGKENSRIPFNLIDHKTGYFATCLDSEGNKIAIYGNS